MDLMLVAFYMILSHTQVFLWVKGEKEKICPTGEERLKLFPRQVP